MILNEIQTYRPLDRYGSDPTPPPPPPPYHTHRGRGDFADSDFYEALSLSLKKCCPLTSVMYYCNIPLRMYLCYILHYYPISGKYFMPVESPEMFITVYWVYF